MEMDFYVLWKPLSFLFFLQVEAVSVINGTFFGKDFIPASRKGSSVQWKQFSFIQCFFPASTNR